MFHVLIAAISKDNVTSVVTKKKHAAVGKSDHITTLSSLPSYLVINFFCGNTGDYKRHQGAELLTFISAVSGIV